MYYFLLSRKRSNKGGDATFSCWNEAIWQDHPSLHLSGKHNSTNLVSYLQPKWGPSLINRFKTHIHSYLHTSSRYFLLCTYALQNPIIWFKLWTKDILKLIIEFSVIMYFTIYLYFNKFYNTDKMWMHIIFTLYILRWPRGML